MHLMHIAFKSMHFVCFREGRGFRDGIGDVKERSPHFRYDIKVLCGTQYAETHHFCSLIVVSDTFLSNMSDCIKGLVYTVGRKSVPFEANLVTPIV